VGPGQEVIIPAFMWVATVGAVVQLNAIPVLCEIDESFCMDPSDLERKITSHTSLIVPVHMAGTPCDMDAIMGVARRRRIPVLEDCAQCNGGAFKGRKVGTFGDAGILRLQLNKNMTSGEGGLIITRDERLYLRAFAGHDMGLIRVEGRLAMPEPDAISWGDGRRMSALTGAVAAVQLSKLNDIVDHMRGSNRRIRDKIQNTPGLRLRRLNDPAGDAGPFVIFTLESEEQALRAVKDLKAAGLHNVFRIADYGLHIYYNIPSLVNKVALSPAGNPWSHEANRDSIHTYDRGACPASDALFARSVLLPVPSHLTPEQEAGAAEIVQQAVADQKG